MPQRTVLLGLMTYRDEDGLDRFGLQGETVQVHANFVERFDSLNIDPGPPFVVEQYPVDMVSGGGVERPQPRGRGRKEAPNADS
jgi:hypothetical protein